MECLLIFICHINSCMLGLVLLFGLHCLLMYLFIDTVKPVLSGRSKMDKTNVLKTNGSFMKH